MLLLLERARYRVARLTELCVVVFAAFQIHQGLFGLILIGWRQGASRTCVNRRDNFGQNLDLPADGFGGIQYRRAIQGIEVLQVFKFLVGMSG